MFFDYNIASLGNASFEEELGVRMKSNWLVVLAVLLCLMVFSTVFAEETNTDCCCCNCCSSAQCEKDQTDNCDVVPNAVNADEEHKVSYIGNDCLAAVPTDEKGYKFGESVQVLFEPVAYTDYQIFYGWDGNGDGIADFGYDYNTFIMGDSDVTLTAICIPAWSSNYKPAKPGRPCLECGCWTRPWEGKDWFYNADPWGTCHGGNCGRGWRR